MIIAIPLAGDMGAGIGAVLARRGNTVLTCLDGRSEATRRRAEAAGLQAVAFDDLAGAELILSIVPPGIADEIATRLAAALPVGAAPVYIDLNAINPDTARRVAARLPASVRFADGSIIGGPPTAGGKVPRLYVSGPAAEDALLLRDHGLDIEMLPGGIGAASALKMCYGAITKGSAALMAAILLAAEREGVGAALHAEMADSQAGRLADARTMLPTVYAKAYRWVAEMEQIAGFLGPSQVEAGIWQSMADFYARLADDASGPREETGSIDRFLARNDTLA